MFGHPSYDLPVVLVFVAVVILPGTITSHRCACCRRACSCCPGSSVPVVFFVRVRAILDVAVDAHVPLGRVEVRAAVLHDGAVDVVLNCTLRLDDDNVVLADCELVEAFVHATFNPPGSIHPRSGSLLAAFIVLLLALLPLCAGKWVRLAGLVLPACAA